MATRSSKGAQDAQTIATLIEDIDITMFTTVGPGGYLVSRPLSTQKAQFDGERVWFFVASDSPKVAEIARNSKVNLAYASKARNTYVSITGDAVINEDRARIEALWDDALKAYFPRGVNDPKPTLIEVQAHTAEYWNGPGSLIGKAVAFAVARVTRRKEAMGENRIVALRGPEPTSKLPPSRAAARGAAAGPAKKSATKTARTPATRKPAGGQAATPATPKTGKRAAKTTAARS